MRIVRFAAQGKTKFGILEKGVIRGLRNSPFVRFKGRGTLFPLDGSRYGKKQARLLPPCMPSKIVGVGLNYRGHSEEFKAPLPSEPLIFLKPSTAIIGPEEKIMLPPGIGHVDYEGELGVVIGRKAKQVDREVAKDYVLGYVCFNDVTGRDIQKRDGQWTRAKGFDTFAPLGPWIETEADPDNLEIETRLNGELRQSARTRGLIFGVAQLVEFISGVMMLLPGDIITTGTPAGIGPMRPGDVVEVEIEKIGTLRNYVTDEQNDSAGA